MIGAIVIWSGLVSNIPSGWQLCDGTNGTPDLRGKFVKGASGDPGVGSTGGALDHTHTFTGDGHTHSHLPGLGLAGGSVLNATSQSSAAAGTTDSSDSQPPWYKLAYIQKMS